MKYAKLFDFEEDQLLVFLGNNEEFGELIFQTYLENQSLAIRYEYGSVEKAKAALDSLTAEQAECIFVQFLKWIER